MKVLHTITTISRGGAESHLVSLVREQVKLGYTVTVAYLKERPYWRGTFEAMGVRVVDLGLRRYGDLSPVARLRSLIAGDRPALVHAHMPPAELYTRLALLGTPSARVPFLVTKHNDERFYDGPGQRRVGRWVARRASRVIAISEAVRDFVCGKGLGCPPDKVLTIRYGIDPGPYERVGDEEAAGLRAAWGAGDSTLVVGTVARLAPQKSLHTLLEAFARLRSSIPDSRLVVAGVGPLEAELKRRSAELGLEPYVVWAGFREDVPALMRAYDLFALPSIYEGFGLVLLEAMAARRPVVASRVSAIPEVVADGVTGRLVPPGDAGALAAALVSLGDPGTRARLGAQGHRRATTEFSLERMVDRTLAVYGESMREVGVEVRGAAASAPAARANPEP